LGKKIFFPNIVVNSASIQGMESYQILNRKNYHHHTNEETECTWHFQCMSNIKIKHHF